MKISQSAGILIIALSVIALILGIQSSLRINCLYDCSFYQILKFYFILILIYLLPGYSLSRLFSGSLRDNAFVYILGSMIIIPVLLTFLGLFFEINLISIALLLCFLFLACRFAEQKLEHKLRLKAENEITDKKFLKICLVISAVFLVMVAAPRLNILMNRYSPVLDDIAKIAMVTSVASSGIPPSHYDYPATPLVYYYYGYVLAGLVPVLTDNFITVPQAWFFHVLIQSAICIWLIIQLARAYFKTVSGILLAIGLMTFMGGYDYLAYLLRDPSREIVSFQQQVLFSAPHSEWWTIVFDWSEPIKLQISTFYKLFLWVPQHLIAGLFIIILFFIIFKTEGNKWMRSILIGLVLASAFGYSIFAAAGILVPYSVWNIMAMIKRKKISGEFILSLCIFVLSSSYLIYLFSHKKSILFFRLVSGSIVDKWQIFPDFLAKPIDFLLTIPPYLLIELGMIQLVAVVLVISKRKKFITNGEDYFWFLTFISTFPLIFIISSINNNDFGMRFIIPAQVAMAVLTVLVIEKSSFLGKKKVYSSLFVLLIFISLVTVAFEFKEKTFNNPGERGPLLQFIEKETPPSSIIFTHYDFNKSELTPAYAYRLTFRPVSKFSDVDKQYTGDSMIKDENNLSTISEICSFLNSSEENRKLLKRPLYFINTSSFSKFTC